MGLHIVVHPRFGDTACVATEVNGRPQLVADTDTMADAVARLSRRTAAVERQWSPALTIGPTRVVIDGKVIEEDGESDDSRRTIALDPYTLGVLRSHVNLLDAERAVAGEHHPDHGLRFCWEDGRPPQPDTITTRFNRLADAAGPAPHPATRRSPQLRDRRQAGSG